MAVSGTTPLEGTGSRRAQQRGVRRDLVPGAGLTRFPVGVALRDTIPSLQPTLPKVFDSWAQVFTDLRVSEAFKASPLPRCLAPHPELAAPFVAEVGAAIREKQLHRRPVEVLVRRESVVEPAHERTGGPDYIALRNAMESAQANYFAERRADAGERKATLAHSLPAEVVRAQSAYFAARERHQLFGVGLDSCCPSKRNNAKSWALRISAEFQESKKTC